jgi:hypothetical protein
MSSSRISQRVIISILFVALLLTGCLSPSLPRREPTPAGTDPLTGRGKTISPDEVDSGGWLDWDGEGGWTSGDKRAVSESGRGVAVEAEAEFLLAAEAPPAADAASAPVEAPMPAPTAVPNQGQSPLRAGEVDDNANWDDYLLYRLNYSGPPVHDREVDERYVVVVNDQQGRPLLDAGVTFYAGDEPVFSGRTYATGQVLFFPQALGVSSQVTSFRVVVDKENVQQEVTLIRGETHQLTINLAHAGRASGEPVNLDVLFLIDSTGSMADEIDKLQESIQEIAARIDRLPSQPQVRFGMTIYRDRGDLFVSRTFDFTPNVDDFSQALAEVEAEGGGDYPESLNEAFHRAIHGPEWRARNSAQLIFLVADAPPHLDYAQDYDYADDMVKAAELGIKVFPIASSGLDDQGEYIFRQIALFTQGRFIFLTYGPGGEPGDSTTHHVDDYTVQKLDDLVVRLVEEELAHQE